MVTEGRSTAAVIDEVLAGQPEVAARLATAHEAAWATVDPVLLELCRLRIAQLLGDEGEAAARTPAAVAAGLDEATVAELRSWPSSPRFGPRERACLALCEQSVVDVAGIDRGLTDAVAAELGVQGLADLVSALLVVEQRQRLHLLWSGLFGTTGAEVPDGGA
ncbi:MAG: carboxymuconolactone decarboxylase family protein [Acidimicrobiia bacterium]